MYWLSDEDYVYHLKNDLIGLTSNQSRIEKEIDECPYDSDDLWDLSQDKEKIDSLVKATKNLLNKFNQRGIIC